MYLFRLVIATALAVALCACSQPSDQQPSAPPPEPSAPTVPEVPPPAPAMEPPTTTDRDEAVTLSDIDSSFEQLIHEVATYSAAERDRALASIRTELREIDARIDALALRTDFEADQLSDKAQAQREAAVAALKEQRAAVQEWTESMREDSAKAWSEVRDGFASAYEELGVAFADAEKAFED